MKSKFLIIAVVVFLVLFLVMLFSPAGSSSFTPQSLYADNGISITLQGADTSGLKLSIDNQGAESIHVYGDSAVINGFSIPAPSCKMCIPAKLQIQRYISILPCFRRLEFPQLQMLICMYT